MEHHSLHAKLLAFNDLLVSERCAITNLQMDRIKEIQEEKTELLRAIRETTEIPDAECRKLAKKAQSSNRRNGWLLRSGLKLVSQLQNLTRQKLASTYNACGRSLRLDEGPKVFAKRV